MWGTLGSFRDSIEKKAKVAKEKALAVADAAQSALQVAAEEDEQLYANPQPYFEQPADTNFSNTQHSSSSVEPPSDSFPPPPPPDSDTDILPPPPPPGVPPPGVSPPAIKAPRARSSRYVVTGVKTTPSIDDEPVKFTQPIAPSIAPSTSVTSDNAQLEPTQNQSSLVLDAVSEPSTFVPPDLSTSVPPPPPPPYNDKTTAVDDSSGWGFGDDNWSIPQEAESKESEFPIPSPPPSHPTEASTAPAVQNDVEPSDHTSTTHPDLPSSFSVSDTSHQQTEKQELNGIENLSGPPPTAFFESELSGNQSNSESKNNLETLELDNEPAPWDLDPEEITDNFIDDTEQKNVVEGEEEKKQPEEKSSFNLVEDSSGFQIDNSESNMPQGETSPKFLKAFGLDHPTDHPSDTGNTVKSDVVAEKQSETDDIAGQDASIVKNEISESHEDNIPSQFEIPVPVASETSVTEDSFNFVQQLPQADSGALENLESETNPTVDEEFAPEQEASLALKHDSVDDKGITEETSSVVAEAFGFEADPDPIQNMEDESDSWPALTSTNDEVEDTMTLDETVQLVENLEQEDNKDNQKEEATTDHHIPTEEKEEKFAADHQVSVEKKAEEAFQQEEPQDSEWPGVSKPSTSGLLSDDVNWFSEDVSVPKTDDNNAFLENKNNEPLDSTNDEDKKKADPLENTPVWEFHEDGGGSALYKERSAFQENFLGEDEVDLQGEAFEQSINPEQKGSEPDTTSIEEQQAITDAAILQSMNDQSKVTVVEDHVDESKRKESDEVEFDMESVREEATNETYPTMNGFEEHKSDVPREEQHGREMESNFSWSPSRVHPDYDNLKAQLDSTKGEYENATTELEKTKAEHENASAQLESTQNELESKKKEINSLVYEKESAMSRAKENEQEADNLRQLVEELRNQVLSKENEHLNLSSQVTTLAQERDLALEEKLIVERERDMAAERGGDGLREARSVIGNLQSDRASVEARMNAIAQDAEQLRSHLDRVSAERDHLMIEADSLRNAINDVQAESLNKVDDMGQRIKMAETQTDIARYEREKFIESNDLLKEEVRKLQEELHERISTLARFGSHQKDLEMELQSMTRQREEDRRRSEALSNLAEEFKDQTRGIVDERNILFDEKIRVENERDQVCNQLNEVNRKLLDVEREVTSLKGEKDEWKVTSESLREQVREANTQQESIASERNRLLQERANEASASDRGKALAIECEQKTKGLAILNKKLTSATSKIEKLTSQRNTFKRQREDAGMRLRAAGSEFMALNSKLEELTTARDDLQKQIVSIRSERDAGLTKIQELTEFKSKFEVASENLNAKEKDIEELRQALQEEQRKHEKVVEESSSIQQKCATLQEKVKETESQIEITTREKELVQSRLNGTENETERLVTELKQAKSDRSTHEAKFKESEAARSTDREKHEREVSLRKSELEAEQKSKGVLEERISSIEKDGLARQSMEEEIRRTLLSSLSAVQFNEDVSLELRTHMDIEGTLDLVNSTDDIKVVAKAIADYFGALRELFDEFKQARSTLEEMAGRHSQLLGQFDQSQQEVENLRLSLKESSKMRVDMASVHQKVEVAEREREEQASIATKLEEDLRMARQSEYDLAQQLQTVQDEMRRQIDESTERWASEKASAEQNADAVTAKLQSIWGMLERAIGTEQATEIWTDAEYNEESLGDKMGVAALRATASMLAELGRKNNEAQELGEKLTSSDAEVARLIDRAEIAESERDSLKATVERVERKANSAHEDGIEEARGQFEAMISKLEDELADSKDQGERLSEKAIRSDKESGELRALCNKLTAQLNGRTNELDEAEEKLAYLQDQVTTLEEDLQEAHRRLKQEEETSAHSHQSNVDRLRKDIEERTSQLEKIELECSELRGRCDAAEKKAAESEYLATTHKQAEDNLQIAIEQLEAAQESAVEQRTIELEKKLREAEEKYKEAHEKEQAAMVSKNELDLRDDEIRELRGAIGRLSDERVELKLELEKNLSRLNHPDAGGQLVDRRVVRQLLVSYFRVGSVRRRDVLELMSRMLAFSDTDNLAVGLKKRALMDRIGSLVQAPELDDASLPPIGTVSDKWIEFLMKETEEGEEQAGRW